MTRPNQNRRKQLVVDPRMQGKMVFRMAGLPAIAMAGIAAFTGVYCQTVMDEARMFDSDMPDLMPLIWLVIAFEVFAAGILIYHSLRISHTVAGPAYRLKKSLERIRSGDISFTVNLRKGDHLTDVRDELNLLLDWLRQHPPQGIAWPPSATATIAATATADAAEAADPATPPGTSTTGSRDGAEPDTAPSAAGSSPTAT